MKPNLVSYTSLLVLLGLFAAACGSIRPPSAAQGTATPIPVVSGTTNVVAEGRLVPRESTQLSFFTSGQVAEISVKEGDQVTAGDVVARLGSREELESAIANAQVELLAAQQSLKKLSEDLPQAQTEALQALNDARDALRAAERRVSGLGVNAEQIDIDVARSNVALAEKALKQARKDYRPYENKPENDFRRAAYLSKMADAQKRYDNAVKQLNRLTGVVTQKFELEQAQTELSIAQSRLKLAEEEHELLKNGPDPDDTAAAEARIAAAKAALTSAQASLSHLDLQTTISGMVVNQDLILGQQVSAGAPVMRIADFSQMYVETEDLTEIEVVQVSPGQKVSIVPDALPELTLTGVVESIDRVYEEKRGDITYTVRILLDEVDPRLRWGMTVETTFE